MKCVSTQLLTGSYALHPGAQPGITGQRPVLSQGLLGRLLRGRDGAAAQGLLGQANALTPGTRCLNVLSADAAQQVANLRSLAHAMASDPQMAQYPTWQGQCAETGPWARLRHDPGTSAAQTAWTRLSARWIELLEIVQMSTAAASPVRAPLLSCGALALGAHQAIAWCEMARGLLLHWLRLDAQGRVQDYQVLAPTEWNFHPQGGLAQALTALGPQDTASAWVLAAAYDACVECSVSSR